MKVLLVSPYSEHLVGGIITWTKYIINYHREHGGDVELCLLNNENAEQIMGGANLFARLVAGMRNCLPVVRDFKKNVRKEQFEVAHICSSASFGLIRDLLVVREARKRGIKTAVHMHFGRIPQILKTKGWERTLLLRLLKHIDCAVVMDMASFRALKEAGFNNVCYLPNPLSLEVQQLIEKQGNLERESRKIVFAGHVGEAKGVFELVEACRDIQGVKLELLGKITTEDTKGKLLSLAGNGADQWLSIPGNKPFEEVIREMLTCNVFVLPSYTEGFPNVILESMACGCPIVATPVGAIPEMLNVNSDKPCGVCIPVKNVDELRMAIVDIIGDQNKAKKLGNNAHLRVNEMYVMPKVWEQIVEIWKNI